MKQKTELDEFVKKVIGTWYRLNGAVGYRISMNAIVLYAAMRNYELFTEAIKDPRVTA